MKGRVMAAKKNLLLNPQDLRNTLSLATEDDYKLFETCRDFFEHKGTFGVMNTATTRMAPNDFYEYIKESGFFSKLLTPEAYGDGTTRWDHYLVSAASELLGFYGFYQYTFQCSVLGLGPIWESDNEKQKREAAQQLAEGNIFAFGMSEKAHGADIYTTDCYITPVGDGKYVANGQKYYIGNSSRASKISVFGKNTATGEYCIWVVDSRDRHCKYCGDIETPALVESQIGYFDMIEYPLTEDDILINGNEAFGKALGAVNIGKTQTSIGDDSKIAHMLYECVHHSKNRILYGKPVTDMPHIRRMLLEAWCRLVVSRNYAYRAVDYFRASSQTDRRFLCYNPIQKAYSAGQCEKAAMLLLDVMAAKAYERDMFASYAIGAVGMPVRLEGTAHVNLAQVVKFMPAYFGDYTDDGVLPADTSAHDDAQALFHQGFGHVADIRFPDPRKSFEGCNLPNVKVYQEQFEALGEFQHNCPMTKAQAKNPDFALNICQIFASIVYGQLFYEKAKQNGIEDDVIDQCFSYIVRDNSAYALTEINSYAGYLEPGQKEALQNVIKEPVIDMDRENALVDEYILSLDGCYEA